MSEQTQSREIRLPALSATMETATVLQWLVQPGDVVSEGQPLVEVQTDKVDMEVEALFSGSVISLEAAVGDEVELGGVLATLATGDSDLLGFLDDSPNPPAPPSETAALPAAEPEASVGPATTVIPAAPAARKIAADNGVALEDVPPTGKRGQITPEDVTSYMSKADKSQDIGTSIAPSPTPTAPNPTTEPTPAPAAAAAAAPAAAPAPAPAAPAAAPMAPTAGEVGAIGAASAALAARKAAIRRATATVMVASAAIPQFTLYRDVSLGTAAESRGAVGWTTIFLRALALGVRAHPGFNVNWSDEMGGVFGLDTVGVGLAVDRPEVGLSVSTISNLDMVDIHTADDAVRRLVDRTRSGRLDPGDLGPAAITLSNLGLLGVDRFNAMLFPPQPAILSVGRIGMRPVATPTGGLRTELGCEVGLTVDHRVADGADGARLLDTIVSAIERGAS